MIFMHYADRHPLFTYAFYPPKTKRVVFRQDCIFLSTLFPMRHACFQVGMNPNRKRLVTYRSPGIMRDGPQAVSFQDWSEADPLPSFDDDVSGFELYSPGCFPEAVATQRPEDHPRYCPDRHEFEPSFVRVPAPTVPTGEGSLEVGISQPGPVLPDPIPRKSSRVPGARPAPTTAPGPAVRKRVKQRWFYEAVPAELPSSTPRALFMEPVSTVVRPVDASEISSSASPILGQERPGPAFQGSTHVGSSGTTTLGGGGTGPPALLSRLFQPLQFTGHRGDRFTIKLLYPGRERHSHDYTVFPEMPVPFLRHNLACLLRVDVTVFLFVGPRWVGLDHEGFITERVFPGTITPCPTWRRILRCAFRWVAVPWAQLGRWDGLLRSSRLQMSDGQWLVGR
jgi:hypothetical protein